MTGAGGTGANPSGGVATGGITSTSTGGGAGAALGGRSGTGGTVATGGSTALGGSGGSQGGVLLTATYDGEAHATWQNQTSQSIFLGGCGTVEWSRLEGSTWVNHGAFVVCAWEGIAVEVAAGGIFTETRGFGQAEAGRYRLSGRYGVGCTPGLGLSSAGCTAFFTATSNEFVVPASGGTGGTGTGGVTGRGGSGAGGAGGNAGTGGSTIDCALVGCSPPPMCATGCTATCGCCPCADGTWQGDLVCRGGCWAVPDGGVDSGLGAGAFESFRLTQSYGPCPPESDCMGYIDLDKTGQLRRDPTSSVGAPVGSASVTPVELSSAIAVFTDPALVTLLDASSPPCVPPTDIFESMKLVVGGRHRTRTAPPCATTPQSRPRAI